MSISELQIIYESVKKGISRVEYQKLCKQALLIKSAIEVNYLMAESEIDIIRYNEQLNQATLLCQFGEPNRKHL